MKSALIKFIFTSLMLSMVFAPNFLFAAAPISLSPVVVNEKGKARDIIKESLTIKNIALHKVSIYTFVYNVDPTTGAEEFSDPSVADKTKSLANWLEITRGVHELEPGDVATIPFTIHIDMNAIAGNYFTKIGFARGGSRALAEEEYLKGNGIAMNVNLEVLDDVKEKLQLKKFTPAYPYASGPEVVLSFDIENIGNKDVSPQGDIRIYDRKGAEVGTINANGKNIMLAPDSAGQFAAVWNAGKSFGKFKALLNLEYGTNQKGLVQDTIYFWVIPWGKFVSIFLILMLMTISFTYAYHRRISSGHTLVYESAPFMTKQYKKEPDNFGKNNEPNVQDNATSINQKSGFISRIWKEYSQGNRKENKMSNSKNSSSISSQNIHNSHRVTVPPHIPKYKPKPHEIIDLSSR